MASQLYYYCLIAAALSVGIYNTSIYGSGSALVCLSYSSFTYDQYVTYNKSLSLPISISAPANPDTSYKIVQEGTNILKVFQIAIAILYFAIIFFTFILALIVNSLSNQIPEDFLQMSKCKSFLAMFCKVFPIIIVVIHWIILILIIIYWAMILMGRCQETRTTIPGVLILATHYYNDSKTCHIVTSVIWIFLHYIGAILKDVSYVEPFMYNPRTEGSNQFVHVVLKKLGP